MFETRRVNPTGRENGVQNRWVGKKRGIQTHRGVFFFYRETRQFLVYTTTGP